MVGTALVAAVAWFISDGTTSPASRTSSGSPTVVSPYVSAARIHEAKSREEVGVGAPIFDAILKQVERSREFAALPTSKVELHLVPLSTSVRTYTSVGWPFPIWGYETVADYDDPFVRTGFRPLVTDRTFPAISEPYVAPSVVDGKAIPFERWAWANGTLRHRPPVEETGGRYAWTFVHFTSMGALLGLVACAWFLGALVALVIDARRHRSGRRPVGRAIRRACAALALLAIVLGTAANVRSTSRVSEDRSAASDTRPGQVTPAIPVREMQSRREDPTRERWVAERISEMLPSPESPNAYLAVQVTADWERFHAYRAWGKPLTLFSLTSIEVQGADVGEPFAFPALATAWTGVAFGVAVSTQPHVQRTVHVNVWTLGSIFFVAAVLWWLLSLIRAAFDRRERLRRTRSGACVACGYQVGAPQS